MTEDISPSADSTENTKQQKKEMAISLAIELSARPEGFPFPGIDPVSYQKLKADEEKFPGFATPIDVLIERLRNEGIKVILRADGGDFYILPSGSDDIENDSIAPKHLQINDTMDEKLKELIRLNRS